MKRLVILETRMKFKCLGVWIFFTVNNFRKSPPLVCNELGIFFMKNKIRMPFINIGIGFLNLQRVSKYIIPFDSQNKAVQWTGK